jgi:hypothetical protein
VATAACWGYYGWFGGVGMAYVGNCGRLAQLGERCIHIAEVTENAPNDRSLILVKLLLLFSALRKLILGSLVVGPMRQVHCIISRRQVLSAS